jgi:hypothetical protein
MRLLTDSLISLNQILTAGIAITAFSLLLYALTFNLRNRVARAFAALLAFVTVVYFVESVASIATQSNLNMWLRLQWLGIAFIPVAYLHFADAVLETVGKPSRGRRRLAIRLLYIMGIGFLAAALFSDFLVRQPVIQANLSYLQAGPLFPVFAVYFAGSLSWAGWSFVRAHRLTQTSTTRRRMLYLMTSAAAPALGTFPYLLLVGRAATLHQLSFWSLSVLTNVTVTVLIVVMAYAVAYSGVHQPDRVVKGRLFQWLLRGPVVASTVLSVYVLAIRYGPAVPGYDARMLPILVIATLLMLQFGITLVRTPIERLLFYGADRGELQRLETVGDRLLTSSDLRQFLESVLASLCDALRVRSAFVAAFSDDGRLEYDVSLGPDAPPRSEVELPPFTAQHAIRILSGGSNGRGESHELAAEIFEWGDHWIMPLRGGSPPETLGLLGWRGRGEPLADNEVAVLITLAERAAMALEDRRLQRDVYRALDRLLPKMEAVQRLRATTQASGAQQLAAGPDSVIENPELAGMIKNALSHYWGGPKLTNSPLLRLRVVEQALREHDGNAANALRAVLHQAIERLKPEGQRKFTAEWILYNILEMKFLQNRRVREVALRLAVSEADLYRKQRTAIEQVARAIVAMEKEAAARAIDHNNAA